MNEQISLLELKKMGKKPTLYSLIRNIFSYPIKKSAKLRSFAHMKRVLLAREYKHTFKHDMIGKMNINNNCEKLQSSILLVTL